MPPTTLKERGFHDLFLVMVVLKGLDGLLEIALGFLLIFTDTFSDVVFFLTKYALIEDPDNYFATHLRAFASQSHEVFVIGGLYLIAHGLLKCFISGALWRNYSWAYPVAMVVLGLFIFYEIIGVFARDSIPLMCLAVFDIVMLYLVGREYRRTSHRT